MRYLALCAVVALAGCAGTTGNQTSGGITPTTTNFASCSEAQRAQAQATSESDAVIADYQRRTGKTYPRTANPVFQARATDDLSPTEFQQLQSANAKIAYALNYIRANGC